MNRFIATLAAAAMLIASQAPAFASDEGREVAPVASKQASGAKLGNKAKFAIGLAIGAGIASAIISKNAQADEPNYRKPRFIDARFVDRRDSGENPGMCRVWRTDCRNGSDRACSKYEARC